MHGILINKVPVMSLYCAFIYSSKEHLNEKPKLAIYWGASCGGCEVSALNLHENLLSIEDSFELSFCPCLIDTKYKDVRSLKDRELLLTLFNGAIGNSENKEMAELLRAKSEFLIWNFYRIALFYLLIQGMFLSVLLAKALVA